jgi:sugar lactone lactonase YvrE
MRLLLSSVAAIGISGVILSGCNGTGSMPQSSAAGVAGQSAKVMPAKFAHNVVYVSDQLEKSIVAFPASEHANNPAPLETLSLGVIPEGIWVDRNGILYVALFASNGSFGAVEEFKPGATQPFLTITNGIGEPSNLVVDQKGTLYVDQVNDLSVEILEYPAGQTTPTKTLSITEKGEPVAGQMTLDRHHNLYVHTFFVDNPPSHVYKFANGSSTPQDLGLSGLGNTSCLTSDKAGNLYVSDAKFGISVYAPGKTTATRTISPPANNIFDCFVATRSGKLYVAQGAAGYDEPSLLEYAAGGYQPVNTLSGYLQAPLVPALRAAAF